MMESYCTMNAQVCSEIYKAIRYNRERMSCHHSELHLRDIELETVRFRQDQIRYLKLVREIYGSITDEAKKLSLVAESYSDELDIVLSAVKRNNSTISESNLTE